MFGFSGKHISYIEWTGNGVVESGRNIGFYLSTKRDNLKVDFKFEHDVNGGATPIQKSLTSNTFVTFDNIINGNISSKDSEGAFLVGSQGDYGSAMFYANFVNITSYRRAYRFTDTGSLNKRVAVKFHDNFSITSLSLWYSNGGSLVSIQKLNLREFPNLKYFSLNDIPLTSIPDLSDSIEHAYFVNMNAITQINPKLSKNLVGLGFSACTLTTVDLNSALSNCLNLKMLRIGGYGNVESFSPIQLKSNTILNFSNHTNLRALTTGSSGLIGLQLNNTAAQNFELFIIRSSGLSGTSFTDTLDNILTSPNLKRFDIKQNGLVWSRNFTNSDFSSSLIHWATNLNSINGSINLTTSKPNIQRFITGLVSLRTGQQLNTHQTVNITGLTNANYIDLTGSLVEDLQLPINTVIQTLYLFDNKLDVATNPNLISQINAMTSLIDLRMGNGSFTLGSAGTGQNSTSGLGNGVDLSGLVNCTSMYLNACKITGTLTLPNVNKLSVLDVAGNTGLTTITNLSAHTSLGAIGLNSTTISISLGTNFTNLNTIDALDAQGLTSFDMTGKTTGSWTRINLISCDNLTEVKLTADFNRSLYFSGSGFQITDNPLLTSLVNLEYINWAPQTNIFTAWFNNNALNMTFPIGINNFIPGNVRLQNNAMSTANVDATINNIYTNRTKWNVVTLGGGKSLNIAGTNSTASGTYQAPAGFVLGGTDGTSGIATAKEQIYVLVNNYNWTITYN